MCLKWIMPAPQRNTNVSLSLSVAQIDCKGVINISRLSACNLRNSALLLPGWLNPNPACSSPSPGNRRWWWDWCHNHKSSFIGVFMAVKHYHQVSLPPSSLRAELRIRNGCLGRKRFFVCLRAVFHGAIETKLNDVVQTQASNILPSSGILTPIKPAYFCHISRNIFPSHSRRCFLFPPLFYSWMIFAVMGFPVLFYLTNPRIWTTHAGPGGEKRGKKLCCPWFLDLYELIVFVFWGSTVSISFFFITVAKLSHFKCKNTFGGRGRISASPTIAKLWNHLNSFKLD